MMSEAPSYESQRPQQGGLSKISSFVELRSLMLEVSSTDLETTPSVAGDSNTDQLDGFRNNSRSSSSSEIHGEADPHLSPGGSLVGPRLSARGRTLTRQFSDNMRRSSAPVVLLRPTEDCKPVLPINGSLQVHLTRQCEKSIELLTRLQKPKQSRIKTHTEPIMPKTALRFSKGLAFQFQTKAGLLTSWTWGSGFVIAKLPNGQFSAPCFIADRFFSFGLTAGYCASETCYAIPTTAALKSFLKESTNCAMDTGLTMGYDPYVYENAPTIAASTGDRAHSPAAPKNEAEDTPRSYRFTDGAILDLSTRCGVHMIDEGINEALYGPECTADKILRGEYEIPEVFKPLYEYIANLAAVAPVLRKTVSQFEAEKERVRQRASWKAATMALKSPFRRDTSESSKASDEISRMSRESLSDTSPTASNPVSAGSSFRLFGDSGLLDLNLDESDDEDDRPTEKPQPKVMATINENNIVPSMHIAVIN